MQTLISIVLQGREGVDIEKKLVEECLRASLSLSVGLSLSFSLFLFLSLSSSLSTARVLREKLRC